MCNRPRFCRTTPAERIPTSRRQHASDSKKDPDVGICTGRRRLGDQADHLARCAAAEGLLLQPLSKDRKPDSSAICLGYGGSQITTSAKNVEDDSRGRTVEAHGVVGRCFRNLIRLTMMLIPVRTSGSCRDKVLDLNHTAPTSCKHPREANILDQGCDAYSVKFAVRC